MISHILNDIHYALYIHVRAPHTHTHYDHYKYMMIFTEKYNIKAYDFHLYQFYADLMYIFDFAHAETFLL